VSAVPPLRDRFSELSGLRQFGLALVRDESFVVDRGAAEALVARLLRQASMEAVALEGPLEPNRQDRESGRMHAFGQFVRLYRRHVRRLSLKDGNGGWDESSERPQRGAPVKGLGIKEAVRLLPLELREALLIVVLGGFTHREAALALDIPLAALIARLTRARERLAVLTGAALERKTADVRADAVSHLRVVK
jgi:predicted DNA-binding protein (UPF0251 family)